MDIKIELIILPVTDVDRAKEFYVRAGFKADHDHTPSDDIRFVAGHTRTRAAAEEFCRDKGVRLVDSFGQILSDREVDAGMSAVMPNVR